MENNMQSDQAAVSKQNVNKVSSAPSTSAESNRFPAPSDRDQSISWGQASGEMTTAKVCWSSVQGSCEKAEWATNKNKKKNEILALVIILAI